MERRLASGTGRRPQDQGRGRGAGRESADGSVCSATSTRWRPGCRPSPSTPNPTQRREGPGATSNAPPRPRARRRWPPRPRTWQLTPTQWKTAGDRLRMILDEWKTISGLDRKTDDALWKRYSAARETFNRRRGSHFADLDRERAGRPTGQGAAVRAGRGVDRFDRLGRHQRRRSATCSPSGRPRAARPKTSTTRCGSGSRPPRTRSSRRATR